MGGGGRGWPGRGGGGGGEERERVVIRCGFCRVGVVGSVGRREFSGENINRQSSGELRRARGRRKC